MDDKKGKGEEKEKDQPARRVQGEGGRSQILQNVRAPTVVGSPERITGHLLTNQITTPIDAKDGEDELEEDEGPDEVGAEHSKLDRKTRRGIRKRKKRNKHKGKKVSRKLPARYSQPLTT